MGHKVHPFGFRLGYIRDWQTHWFADRPEQYRTNLLEDLRIRDHIVNKHRDAAVARVELERKSSEVRALIHTARPGVVIGRGGQRVEELRKELEDMTGKRVRVDINEIRQPELEATLVAQSIADQIQRQVSFRRATRQAVQRSMQAGAQGIRVAVSGRLGGAEIARREKAMDGRVPLHTLRADIDFGQAEARTQMGQIGVKVWVYRGDIVTEATPQELARRSALIATPVITVENGATASAVAVAETPAAVVETPAVVAEEPAAVVEAPAAVVETPAVVAEEPAAVVEAPAVVVETPAVVAEEPVAVVETPAVVAEEPAAVVESPAAVAEEPAAVVETPAVVAEEPAAVAETPAVVDEEPAAVAETPAVVDEEPAAVVETPAVVDEEPAAVAETPAEDAAAPVEASVAPAEAQAEPVDAPQDDTTNDKEDG